MTFLFISAYDSMNYVLAACAQEARRRKHRILVVVNDPKDSRNNKIYLKKNIEMISADSMDYSLLDQVDIAIAAPVRMIGFERIYAEIRKRNIFLVSFASLFSSVVMREYPDLVLCLGSDKFREFRQNYLKYNSIAIGNPQYDALVEQRRTAGGPISDVLIIDQGGYPYGSRGKRQLADTLTKIARFHPEKEFYIKPRYGDSEEGRMTHAISEQLIDYIDDPPQNIHVLDGSEILEEIVIQYDAMITTWSTAYIDAVMLNIPLILIGGMDSIDVFDVRRKRVQEAYDHLERTGCLHHYKELQEKRVDFEYVSPAYIEQEIYSHQAPCAERIIQLLEFINKMVLKNGLRIQSYIEEDLGGFYKNFSKYRLVDADNAAYRKRREYLEQFNGLMQEWVYINRCMGKVMDLSELYQMFDTEFSESNDREQIGELLEKAKEDFQKVRNQSFRNPLVQELSRKDRILQDFYFDWLYETKQFHKLINYEGPLITPESRLYNMALFELEQKNRKEAYHFLQQFLDLLEQKETPVVQLLKEKRLLKKLIPFCRGKNLGTFAVFCSRKKNWRIMLKLVKQVLSGGSVIKICKLILRNKLAGGM